MRILTKHIFVQYQVLIIMYIKTCNRLSVLHIIKVVLRVLLFLQNRYESAVRLGCYFPMIHSTFNAQTLLSFCLSYIR